MSFDGVEIITTSCLQESGRDGVRSAGIEDLFSVMRKVKELNVCVLFGADYVLKESHIAVVRALSPSASWIRIGGERATGILERPP